MQKSGCEHCAWVRDAGEPACLAQSVVDDLDVELGLNKWHTPERRRELEAQRLAMIECARDKALQQEAEEVTQLAVERGLHAFPPLRTENIRRLTVIHLRCLTGCMRKQGG